MTMPASSALFLDRDGVINYCDLGKYISRVEEFQFLPGVLIAIQQLARHFQYIFIVTNQAGVGYGYFSQEALDTIHNYMLSVIRANGGRIDKIYVCTDTKEAESFYRKPHIGMALNAKSDFPEVDLEQSYVVGDMQSDIEFAHNMGANAVLLTTQPVKIGTNATVFRDLKHFADWIDIVEGGE